MSGRKRTGGILMKTRLLNAIRDLYNYGPYKAKRLEVPLNTYYSTHIDDSFNTLLDEALKVCEELIDEDRFTGFCWTLSKSILAYQLKGGDKNV